MADFTVYQDKSWYYSNETIKLTSSLGNDNYDYWVYKNGGLLSGPTDWDNAHAGGIEVQIAAATSGTDTYQLRATWLSNDLWSNILGPFSVTPVLVEVHVESEYTVGQLYTFTAPTISAGQPTSLTYQWYRGGILIPEATGNEYSLTPSVADNGDEFYVTVSNGVGPVQTSDTYTLTMAAYGGGRSTSILRTPVLQDFAWQPPATGIQNTPPA